MAKKNKSLATRNNNPGNIRYSKSNIWIGQIGQSKGFVVFDTEYNGYRALCKLLVGYYRRGFRSVFSIISRFAPAGDGSNNPHLYSRMILHDFISYLGVSDIHDYEFDLSSFGDIRLLAVMACSIARVEGFRGVLSVDDVYSIILKFV